jgi:hypothetical protein
MQNKEYFAVPLGNTNIISLDQHALSGPSHMNGIELKSGYIQMGSDKTQQYFGQKQLDFGLNQSGYGQSQPGFEQLQSDFGPSQSAYGYPPSSYGQPQYSYGEPQSIYSHQPDKYNFVESKKNVPMHPNLNAVPPPTAHSTQPKVQSGTSKTHLGMSHSVDPQSNLIQSTIGLQVQEPIRKEGGKKTYLTDEVSLFWTC